MKQIKLPENLNFTIHQKPKNMFLSNPPKTNSNVQNYSKMSKFDGWTIFNFKFKQYKIYVHVTNQIHPKLTLKPHLVHHFTLQRIHAFVLIISNSPVILFQAKAYNQFHITSNFKIL